MSAGIRLGMVGSTLLLGCLVAGIPRPAQAQQAAIGGQVVDEATGTPLEAARVLLTGTGQIETTNREGRFIFRQVAPGPHQVRVLRVGYKPATLSTTVAAGETAALNFSLAAAVVQLDELVTTATGEQRKLEIGNAVTTIDAARVAEQAPITEFTNLISGRAPGVQVLKSSGTTGTGTRIRIRGSNSISLSNEPLYYLDGIRLESNPTSSTLDIGGFGSGIGAGPSRINDLNPDDIQDIEIVKGPAAATLYGIQASNGVIRVTTKRGVAGPPQWSLFSELGTVSDPHTYPLNYFGRDTTATGIIDGYDGFCSIQSEIDGLCTQTSLQTFQPLNEPVSRPYKAGLRQQYGASVSGGSEQVTYYLSGSYENEIGPFRLPQAEFDSVASVRGGIVPDNQVRPNALEKFGLRANIGANVSKTFELTSSLGFSTSNTRFIENDNSFLTVNGSGTASGSLPEDNRGWFFIPAELFAELANQKANRFTAGISGTWRPREWLTARAVVGHDLVDRTDLQFFPTGQVAAYLANRDGVKIQNAFDISQTSIDLGASARFRLTPVIGSRTSVGAQFFRDLANGTFASGRGLPPGSGTINGASAVEAADTTVEARSVGTYVEQELSFNERLFVTGAVRFDDNSAFGQNFDATLYPKASVSWLVSDKPGGSLNTFRVRAAFGVSGQQPGTADALRIYNSVPGKRAGIGTTGVSFSSLGNFDLKPERSREFEAGFDAGLFNDRVSVEFTFYSKLTRDALISRDIAPSLGASQSQFVNLSRIRNRGVELAINTRIIDSRSVAWDLTLSGSTANNKILELGEGVSDIFVGFYQRHVGGYPAGGFWAPTHTFADANSDDIIDLTEVTLSDSSVFLGTAIPTREASLNSQLAIFGGQVVLGTQFDYRGGHKVDNSLEQFRCFSVQNCRGNYDRSAPLDEQARAQALFLPGGGNSVAFLEPGWFIKLREVSLTFFAPDRWARAFRSNRLSLTLSGRNLWTIDDYSGVDPEVNAFAQDNFASSDFESQAQVRYWTARLNVGF
ncbi:MAG: SusC/RagA family TonB-linked outer membrane protein [Gemmatimonadales bacterium]|nr:SusC/RagA family TonB-linked outer membrane protein [Gemmatimonadales bacterium]